MTKVSLKTLLKHHIQELTNILLVVYGEATRSLLDWSHVTSVYAVVDPVIPPQVILASRK